MFSERVGLVRGRILYSSYRKHVQHGHIHQSTSVFRVCQRSCIGGHLSEERGCGGYEYSKYYGFFSSL